MTVVIDTLRFPKPVLAKATAEGGGPSDPGPPPAGRLYKPREPIYPKLAHGRFRTVKWVLMAIMLAIYYGVPWIRWPRPGAAPDQAILVDFAHGRFYLFGLHLWPQEVYFVTGLLVISALGLFLATALFGRLWCGYACPQTVWTDLFLYVERLFEGDRNARMRLAAKPWSFDKVWRKGGKHLVWLAIAGATGGAWIFYFQDAPSLWRDFWRGTAPITSYVSFWGLTFTTYWLAGHMREQVCTYMCPWPRIQGAMLDEHSLQVSYRGHRGEPRAPHKTGSSWEGRGDCIDCRQCVVVCPMGIDIRNGPQLECINCGLCIDACDEIMVKVGRPKGLIAFDSVEALEAKACGKPAVYKYVRPRTIYYLGALGLVSAVMAWGLWLRSPADIHVVRDRNPMFVRLHDGSVRNGYTLKLSNHDFTPRTYMVRFSGVAGATLKTPGEAVTAAALPVVVEPDSVRAVRVLVSARTDAPMTAAQFSISDGRSTHAAKTVFVSAGGAP